MDKILVLTSSFVASIKLLSNYEVKYNDLKRKLNRSELIKYLDEDVVGIIAGLEEYDLEVFNYAPRLRVISRCGSGIDNISSELIDSDKIRIFSTLDAPTNSVAELTLGLILNLLRQVNQNDSNIRMGFWDKKYGSLLGSKTVGIVGLGRIGRRVADLISTFGARILYYDIKSVSEVNFEFTSIESLLANSDIVSIHLPYNDSTKNIMNANRLKLMKKDSYIVNTSRGGLIDEDFLYKMLKEKQIVGAALDVFSEEPYRGPLIDLTNVLLTPHIGSYTNEGRLKQEEQSINNLLYGLNHEKLN
jgi:D-3-phosphoglycerate dehydrogenase